MIARASGGLEYAQARLCAHHGRRPDELAWRRIEHLRELPALLDAARTSPLRMWLAGIDAASSPQLIERTLRNHYRAHVEEVAGWMPPEWQPALLWCARIVELPAIEHLARGGVIRPWMHDDDMLRALVERESAYVDAVHVGGMFAPFSAAWSDPEHVAGLWHAEWQRRLPPHGSETAARLAELTRLLRRHWRAFRDPALRDGWPARRTLQAELELLFRRAILDPAAAFVHLALSALDVERLAGELLRRAAFPRSSPAEPVRSPSTTSTRERAEALA